MIQLTAVLAHQKKLEEILNKDMSFVMQSDGSGCFETFFDAECYQQFENLKELNVIVNTNNLKPILINEV